LILFEVPTAHRGFEAPSPLEDAVQDVCIQDSLGARGTTEMTRFFAHASGFAIKVVPEWSLRRRWRVERAAHRAALHLGLHRRGQRRLVRPTRPSGGACCAIARGRGAWLIFPAVRHLAVDPRDLHRQPPPLRWPGHAAARAASRSSPRGRLAPRRISNDSKRSDWSASSTGCSASWRRCDRGLEIDFFDLDFDSFVHRAMVRALVQTGLPTTNYCERSYAAAAAAIPRRRAHPLDSLGLAAPLVCGSQLKNFDPPHLVDAMGSVAQAADGYFIFTSYSLWQAPSQLTGPYVLAGRHADYWRRSASATARLTSPLVSGRSVVAPVPLGAGSTATQSHGVAHPHPLSDRRDGRRHGAHPGCRGPRGPCDPTFPALSPGVHVPGLGRARRRRRGGIRRLLRAGRSAGRDPDGATRGLR